MIDVPTEMTTSPSILYLDPPSLAGGVLLDGPIEDGGGGGGVDYLVGDNRSRLAGDRAIQSNGYILIDYDGDKHYDQAWFGVNGVWQTSTGGGTWVTDNGPLDELIDLWERGFIL